MKIINLFLVSTLVSIVAGCAGSPLCSVGVCLPGQSAAEQQQRYQQVASTNCLAFGFTPGTPEFSQCMQQSYSDSVAQDEMRRAAAAAQINQIKAPGVTFTPMPTTPATGVVLPTPSTTTTNCKPDGFGGVRCVSK